MPQLELPASEESLQAVADLVRSECRRRGVGRRDLYALTLICDELASNICRYAYPGGGGEYRFGIEFDDTGHCELSFVDHGIPFDPTGRATPDTTADIDDRPIGGLGIHFVRENADQLIYERRDGSNVVTVRRRLEEAVRDPE